MNLNVDSSHLEKVNELLARIAIEDKAKKEAEEQKLARAQLAIFKAKEQWEVQKNCKHEPKGTTCTKCGLDANLEKCFCGAKINDNSKMNNSYFINEIVASYKYCDYGEHDFYERSPYWVLCKNCPWAYKPFHHEFCCTLLDF